MSSENEFQPLDERSRAPLCGPLALLLAGYSATEGEALRLWFEGLGFGPPRVLFCARASLAAPLEAVLQGPADPEPLPPELLPRTLLLSGLASPQIRVVVERYHETGLPRPIFAATTPSNLKFSVRDLLRHLLAEHRAASGGDAASR